jgi:hypothetical protein
MPLSESNERLGKSGGVSSRTHWLAVWSGGVKHLIRDRVEHILAAAMGETFARFTNHSSPRAVLFGHRACLGSSSSEN